MKTWRALFGRDDDVNMPTDATGSAAPAKRWNTLSTLGVGAVAEVDDRGAVFPRSRPVSVEVWFGAGDRWVRGTAADGVRQSRVVGLPVIETRQRLGESDIVQTAWADESGDSRGRVVISLLNETDVAAIAAVVVRPQGLTSPGRIDEVRSAESFIVVDKLPLVELGRVPGDTVGAVDDDADTPALLARLALTKDELVSDGTFTDSNGKASFAALLPLTPGVERQIQILDGREATTVAPAPLENIVSGWRTHLTAAAEIELPAWPKHIPPALVSSLIGSVADERRPLGDASWVPEDDTVLIAALGGVGLDWAAATVADRLLASVTNGDFDRARWTALGAALCHLAGTGPGDEVLQRHGEAVAAIAGHTLTAARSEAIVPFLLRVVHAAHGSEAAADAAAIRGELKRFEDGLVFARHGIATPTQSFRDVEDALDKASKPYDAETLGLAMTATADLHRPFEPLVPLRSLAGSTWRWPRSSCGDSPHARAALLIGLRAMAISQYPGSSGREAITATGPIDIDLFPGAQKSWLGQNMQISRMPTAIGRVSAALRWHGERAALLWEIDEPTGPFELTCTQLGPGFRTSDASGEALLDAPDPEGLSR